MDFGDYTMAGDNYTYTYVDRKSETDFKGTLGVGFNRFTNEIERAKRFNAYLYIVIESSIDQIIKNNKFKIYDLRNLYNSEEMQRNNIKYYSIGRPDIN